MSSKSKRALSLASLGVLGFASLASAAAITPGDIVVYRVGDGSVYSTGTTAPVFLDEYSTTGTLVQSIAMPTTSSGSQNALTSLNNGNSEGFLTQSGDGRYLAVPGYNAAPNSTSATVTSTSTIVPRTIGLVNIATGNVDTSTQINVGGTARSAYTVDGTNDYYVGSSTTYGFVYTTTGSTNAGTTLVAAQGRLIKGFGSQLYGTSTFPGTVGSGYPTTSGQSFSALPGISASTTASGYSFYLADLSATVPGYDTLYVADDSVTTGGIQKYCLNSGTWVKYGTVDAATGSSNDESYRGLDGYTLSNGTSVELFATNSGTLGNGKSDNQLVSFVDTTGYDATISSGEPTLLATAGANETFRGDAFVEAATPEPMSFTLFGSGALLLISRRRRADIVPDAV